MRHYKPSKSLFLYAQRPKAIPDLRKAKTPEIVGVGRSGEAAPVFDTARGTMTKGELISRAKRSIEAGETLRGTSFRAAAAPISRRCEAASTEPELAEGGGRSPA